MSEPGRGKRYKVRLKSGRVLGPLDLDRVRQLIRKGHIVGEEQGKEYPDGQWKPVHKISDIAEIFLKILGGEEFSKMIQTGSMINPIQGDDVNPDGSTQILPEKEVEIPVEAIEGELEEISQADERPLESNTATIPLPELDESDVQPKFEQEPEDKTVVDTKIELDEQVKQATEETVVGARVPDVYEQKPEDDPLELSYDPVARQISDEKTIAYIRNEPSKDRKTPGKFKGGLREIIMGLVIALGIGFGGYEVFLADEEQKGFDPTRTIRPVLPKYKKKEKADPQKSGKFYGKAIKFYLEDNVVGYRKAAGGLLKAASYDINNVKALAILTSCYINLIDSSKKDANYFSVVNKLVELSRAKAVDLPETVIADVEFFISMNRPGAAKRRIVEYTKRHSNFGVEMYYYLALAFFNEGDYRNASRYIIEYPDNRVSSPRVFYLRGRIAEKLNEPEKAIEEYNKAIKLSTRHAKSHLRKSALLAEKGKLKKAAKHLEYLIKRPQLLPPLDLAEAYYLHGRLNEVKGKARPALADMEKAVLLDRRNHRYLFELFTLRSRVGEHAKKDEKIAKMYFFLAEGEKLLEAGDYHGAQVEFLKARQINNRSAVPLIKMGDMFMRQNDIKNALLNYKNAAKRKKKNLNVGAKYIDALIKSYEWEDATKKMAYYRKLPNSNQGLIDKLAGDMYSKQGQHKNAQNFYRKALQRRKIDPDIYLAYARSLLKGGNTKEAPFFYAIAKRYDPLSVEPAIGTAEAIAAEESIDQAILSLRAELQRSQVHTSALLSRIAAFQLQGGDREEAKATVEEAKAADPKNADPFWWEAKIYLDRKEVDKRAVDKAIRAYRSYVERRPSDPRGYIELYRMYMAKTDFERASQELSDIYGIYPKYPNLHYLKGLLYSKMGKYEASVQEYMIEIKNNPRAVNSHMALGNVYLRAKKFKQALSSFQTAMQISPKAALPKMEAGWANHKLGNYDGAVALYQIALKYDKANPMIYKRLGLAYVAKGDLRSAGKAFSQYLEMEPDAPDRAQFQRFIGN